MSQIIVKQVNSNSVRRCTLISRSVHGEVRSVPVHIFVGNLKGTKLRRGWENNNKRDLKEIAFGGINLTQNKA